MNDQTQKPNLGAAFEYLVTGEARQPHERRLAGERLHLSAAQCWLVSAATIVFAVILASILMR
jgi:hypothetical protein